MEDQKNIGDAISIATVIGTIVDWLPAGAALLSIIWTAIRIWDWWEAKRELRRREGESRG
jgi:hypothetical protein